MAPQRSNVTLSVTASTFSVAVPQPVRVSVAAPFSLPDSVPVSTPETGQLQLADQASCEALSVAM